LKKKDRVQYLGGFEVFYGVVKEEAAAALFFRHACDRHGALKRFRGMLGGQIARFAVDDPEEQVVNPEPLQAPLRVARHGGGEHPPWNADLQQHGS